MSEPTMLLDEEQEFDDMGSFNHSLVQSNLAYLLRKYTELSAFNELSLDASGLDKSQFPTIKDELIPDICAYPKKRSVIDHDILRMQEMPILAIEVVSPRQGILSIVEKLQAYFALGIQSCWLVEPITGVVRVYHPHTDPKTFAASDVIDDVVGIKIPVAEIFD
ncbi:MAG: Uma2 family endonuclease [Caldilineaceae bacterium]